MSGAENGGIIQMKNEKKIKEKLEELKKDERVNYPPANVFSNAPLALIQVELDAKIKTLEWVLKDE